MPSPHLVAMRRLLTIALLCSGVLAERAAAQLVRGRVVTSDSTRGVPGVVLQLADIGGTVVARSLSQGDGSFTLRAPRVGAFTLRTLRLGFRPSTFGPFDVSDAGRSGLQIALRDLPVSIAEVRVTGRNECVLASGRDGGAVLEVWEEARKGLLASLIARTEGGFDVTTTTYERVLSPQSRNVVRQTVRQRRGPSSRPFSSPLAPEAYATLGYREVDAEGSTYRAPDADVLLSEAFAERHCLRIAEAAASDEVGVSFEPLRGRRPERPDGARYVDVAGTLWLDRATARLRRAEFRYTGLESPLAEDNSRGRIDFTYLPTDVPVITAWSLTLPRIVAPLRIADIWISGGELSEARRGDSLVWRSPFAVVRGTVRNGSNGPPARDATVRLAGTDYTAVADSTGAYEISHLLPGRYEVLVGRALGVRLGVAERGAGVVDVRPNQTATLPLEARSDAELVAAGCRDRDGGAPALLGEVRGIPAGADLPYVAAYWVDSAQVMSGDLTYTSKGKIVRAGPDGRVVLCGVPVDRGMQVIVSRDSLSRLRLAIGRARVSRDSAFTAIVLSGRGTGRTRVSGRVLTPAAAPVMGATVELVGGATTRTDSLGRFALEADVGMQSLVRARAVGYEAFVKSVDVVDDAPIELTVTLARGATRLAGVVVGGDSTSGLGGRSGFDARRAKGSGVYITAQDPTWRGATRVEHLLTRIPGVQVDSGGVPRVNHGRISFTMDNCQQGMQVFIDGVIMEGDYSLRDLSLGAVKAIEVYASVATTPFEFRSTRSSCGTVAIWTQ
jgi:hypothetical protein